MVVVTAQPDPYLWTVWEDLELSTVGDDNTGSSVEPGEVEGETALMVMPGGTSEETKLAIPVTGADLYQFLTHSQVVLDIYLPEDSDVTPNMFFMGMADVTAGEFTWIAGVFSESTVQPGWSHVIWTLDPAMRPVLADHDYMIFFSFFNDEAGVNTPLTEPFFIGHGYMTAEDPIEVPAAQESEAVTWAAWDAKPITELSNDNSGAEFSLSTGDPSPGGNSSLLMMPSGTSEETKIAVPFTGADLTAWANAETLSLEVLIPEENLRNPNNFFLGMADVTGGGFTWIAGVFGEASAETGWVLVTYPVHSAMKALTPDHDYMLYLSFFNADEVGDKIPLNQPIYLGSMYIADSTPVNSAAVEDRYRQEVDDLLSMDDDQLVDAVARSTFDYFWLEANPDNGLIKDRSTPDSVSSIAAVGFGLAAIPIGVDRGWISYDEGYERALTTLQTFTGGGVEGIHGFFYHFVDMETGEREWSSELSSIDTALLVAGALVAGQYFADTEVATLADQLYANVEWDWMAPGGALVRMGWTPDGGYLGAAWDHFDESMILYALAIGSPTHAVPARAWDFWDRPVNRDGGYIYLAGEPLFVYQYPLAFLDLRGKADHYANYVNNTALACERNRQFAIDHSDEFTTYQNGVWGLSASDGPTGYRAYGAWSSNHDGTVAPYASASCLPFTPEIALEGMRAVLTEYGGKAWREYGFVSAINEDEDWYSHDHIGIDQGDILLNIANAQDGFVWTLFMANPNIQNALAAMSFVESEADDAVTPAYRAESAQ